MGAGKADLSVRTHERLTCALPAEVWIAEESQESVRLAGSVRNADGALVLTVADCSAGGLGLQTGVYLPRGCRLRVKAVGRGPEGPETIETTVIVRRATMTERTPSYYLGTSFLNAGAEEVVRLLETVRRGARAGAPSRA